MYLKRSPSVSRRGQSWSTSASSSEGCRPLRAGMLTSLRQRSYAPWSYRRSSLSFSWLYASEGGVGREWMSRSIFFCTSDRAHCT
jgi:hypothetical protein